MGTLLSPVLAQLGPLDYYNQEPVAHWCPACEELHPFYVKRPLPNGAKWSFNGDVACPTFGPSMKITWGRGKDPALVCHYYLKAGKLEYLSDCTHRLSGQTVDLPPIPESEVLWLQANEARLPNEN